MLQVSASLGEGAPPYIILGYTVAICSFYLLLLRRITSLSISFQIRNYIDLFSILNMGLLFLTCGLIHTLVLSRLIFTLPEWWDLIIKILLFFNSIIFGFAVIELMKLEGWLRLGSRLTSMDTQK